jgi:hypothetical protein
VPQPLIGPRHRGADLRTAPGQSARAPAGAKPTLTPRSARYLRALRRLDASTQLAPADLGDVVDDVSREFSEKWAAEPLGIVAHCYLGRPYEVHTLTTTGSIIEHYRAGQALPSALEKARELARGDRFLCIEVYGERLVAILPDGSTALMEGKS